MTPNNNLNVLAFYDSVSEQNHRKTFAYGNVYPLVCPVDKLLPFALKRDTIANPISVCNLINLKTGISENILAAATSNGLSVVVYDEFDLIVNYSTGTALGMIEGQYYLEISDGVNTWFSDVFNVVSDLTNFIKIEYWDFVDFVTPDAVIPYGTEFRNWFYVKSEIGKPEYPFAEELEERDGRKYFEKQISEKRFRFEFLAPEFLCDAVRIVRMHDNVLIYEKGKVYGAEEILFTPEFQEQGDLAVVQVEFETSFVIKKLAGGGYETEGGTTPPNIETILGFVRYDAPQTLTEEQKQQARDNIGIGEVGGTLPDGIISGFKVQYANNAFDFNVSSGFVRKDGVAVFVDGINNLDVGPSDPDDPRINVIKVSATEGIQVELGDPTTPPAKPTDLGEGFFEITFVTIEAASTEFENADNDEVFTENAPPNWDVTTQGTGTFNPNYSTNPYEGLISFLLQTLQSGAQARFTKPSSGTIDLQGFETIGMQIYLFQQMNNGWFIQMDLIAPSGFSVCGGWFNLPVLKNQFLQWQFVAVDVASLPLTGSVISQIRIRFYRQSGPATFAGFQLDNLILQGGVNQPPSTGQQNEDIIFPIVERGRSKGVKWQGATDRFSIYVEETGTTPGGSGAYEKCNWVFEFSDNDNSIPEIEDELTFRYRATDGITVVDVLKLKANQVNAFLPILQNGKPIIPLDIVYASEAAMLADQGSQRAGYLYWDGAKMWVYKGIPGGVIGNYYELGGGGGAGGGLELVPFSSSINMTGNFKSYHIQTGAIAYTVSTVSPTTNFENKTVHFISANGTGGKPTFSASFVIQKDTWLNTAGALNRLTHIVSPSGKILVWLENVE